MNRRQKSALRSAHIKLADELILDEDFYAALRQNKIFTDSMIGLIKAEKKPRDRVYKLLELLEKRGPKAFDNFVWILKENYEWLAEMLEKEYDSRRQPVHYDTINLPVQRAQYEESKYLPVEQSSRQEPYKVYSLPAMSPRSCQMIPVQVPYSPCVDGNRPQFFPYRPPVSHQQMIPHQHFCDMEYLTVNVCSQGTLSVDGATQKQFKDACMSPIGIIESPKKTSSESDDNASGTQNNELLYERKTEQFPNEITDEEANNDGNNKDCTNDESLPVNDDTVDGAENVNIGITDDTKLALEDDSNDEDDDAFPSSEVYYDHVRRGSSCLPEFEKEVLLSLMAGARHGENSNEEGSNDADEFEDEMTRTESSLHQNQEYLTMLEDMKNLYFKLVAINTRSEAIEEEGENIITMEMIESEVDKLASQLADSDDSKMVKKCYKLFSEKERKLPLNTCIENVQNEKKEIQERLMEKSKNIDQMVYDLWNHQQDMKNIEKLKKNKNDLLAENVKLRNHVDEIKVSLDQQRLAVVQKDLKLQDLEGKIRDLEEKKATPPRRPMPGVQRRMTTSQITTARRPNASGATNVSQEARMSFVQNSYSSSQLQSPRTTTATSIRKPISRR